MLGCAWQKARTLEKPVEINMNAPLAVVGLRSERQQQATLAQLVVNAAENAKQIAQSSQQTQSPPGRVDIRV
ncbi:MAG: hypothetical protein OHK0024_33790 [Thalassobaculales bacterium]